MDTLTLNCTTAVSCVLQRPVVTYLDLLGEDEKDTYAHPSENITKFFAPFANREKFYSEFEQQSLCLSEDQYYYGASRTFFVVLS